MPIPAADMQNEESPPGSPAEARSPASIVSTEVPPNNTDAVTAPPSTPPHQPGSLNFTPCTLEQFHDLDFGNEERYELLDGLAVSIPMGDDEEGRIINYLVKLLTLLPPHYDVDAYSQQNLSMDESHPGDQPSHQASSSTSRVLRSNGASSSKSNPSSSSSAAEKATKVIPDLHIVKKSDGSQAEGRPQSPFRGSRTPDPRKALLILEVSSTNAKNDLERKVGLYESNGVKEYVVVHRDKSRKQGNRNPCVKVFTLNARRCYEEREYRDDEKVNASYLEHWGLTAKQLLDYRAIRSLYEEEKEKEREEKEKQRKRADEAQKEKEKEREEKEKQRKRAEKLEEEKEKEREQKEEEREQKEEERKQKEEERKINKAKSKTIQAQRMELENEKKKSEKLQKMLNEAVERERKGKRPREGSSGEKGSDKGSKESTLSSDRMKRHRSASSSRSPTSPKSRTPSNSSGSPKSTHSPPPSPPRQVRRLSPSGSEEENSGKGQKKGRL